MVARRAERKQKVLTLRERYATVETAGGDGHFLRQFLRFLPTPCDRHRPTFFSRADVRADVCRSLPYHPQICHPRSVADRVIVACSRSEVLTICRAAGRAFPAGGPAGSVESTCPVFWQLDCILRRYICALRSSYRDYTITVFPRKSQNYFTA